MRYIKRIVDPKLDKCARKHPIIQLLGPRQSGKTTSLRNLFPNHRVIRFSPIFDIFGARENPDRFLDTYPCPLILRGLQYVPELIPALIERARSLDTPGRYIITSVFHLPQLNEASDIVETVHMSAMTLEELEGHRLRAHWLEAWIQAPQHLSRIIPAPRREHPSLIHYLWRGGLPHIMGCSNAQVSDYLYQYLQTYAERDARKLAEIDDLTLFGRFLSKLSQLSGKRFEAEFLAQQLGMQPKQVHAWLSMITDTYLWRELHAYSDDDTSNRIGYLADSGLACALLGVSSPMALTISSQLADIFRIWVVNYLLSYLETLDPMPNVWHWDTENAQLPLVLELGDRLYPIEICCCNEPEPRHLNPLLAFKEAFGDKAHNGIIVYAGKTCLAMDSDIVAVPWDAGLHMR